MGREVLANRKNINNREKIIGQPEAEDLVAANREAVAAEAAASRPNVEKVYMGEDADTLINDRAGTKISADVIAVTRSGRYHVTEAKGTSIAHGLRQLRKTGDALGKELVERQTLVVGESVKGIGFTVEDGLLHAHGERMLINGKPVHVLFTKQGAGS